MLRVSPHFTRTFIAVRRQCLELSNRWYTARTPTGFSYLHGHINDVVCSARVLAPRLYTAASVAERKEHSVAIHNIPRKTRKYTHDMSGSKQTTSPLLLTNGNISFLSLRSFYSKDPPPGKIRYALSWHTLLLTGAADQDNAMIVGERTGEKTRDSKKKQTQHHDSQVHAPFPFPPPSLVSNASNTKPAPIFAAL